jgi:putative restriction endonuclease
MQQVENADLELWEHHIQSEIESDGHLLETERQAFIVARREQGLFKQRVMRHCKPLRDSSNDERINGENGLLLTPTMDHLFDRGFISFEDWGLLIVSPVANPPSLNLVGVATGRIINVGTLTQGQEQFLDYHRESVLLQARH